MEDPQGMQSNKTKFISKPFTRTELRNFLKNKKRTTNLSKHQEISKSQFLSLIDIQSLDCSICCCPLVQPVTLSCGHSSCLECLEQGSLQSGKCSFCKQKIIIKEILINKAMRRFVKHSFQLLGKNLQDSYKKRLQEVIARDKKRAVPFQSLRVGDDIDYRDRSLLTWFKGSVMQIEQGQDCRLIYVEFDQRHKTSQGYEIFESNSRNIAPAGYFSSRMNFRQKKPQQTLQSFSRVSRINLSQNSLHLLPLLTAP